jgi:hypothetical protein
MSAPDPVTRATDEAEAQAAAAMEHLVGTEGFGGLLGQMAENTAAISRLGTDAMDLVLRNLRLAGRRDVARLSRQLARTEDKLERVLQEIEEFRATPVAGPTPARKAANATPANGKRATR